VRAVLFGAVGTAGSAARVLEGLFLQKNIAPKITEKLIAAYKQVRVGDPSDPRTLMGPLIDTDAVAIMMRALDDIRDQGGEVLTGGERLNSGDCYVEPTLVRSQATNADCEGRNLRADSALDRVRENRRSDSVA